MLKFKGMGEQALMDSGLPFTILRPGRLTDGPYTSYDVNTLLKATSGTKRAVDIGRLLFFLGGGLFKKSDIKKRKEKQRWRRKNETVTAGHRHCHVRLTNLSSYFVS